MFGKTISNNKSKYFENNEKRITSYPLKRIQIRAGRMQL